jgi:hypothetical protein
MVPWFVENKIVFQDRKCSRVFISVTILAFQHEYNMTKFHLIAIARIGNTWSDLGERYTLLMR